MSPIELEAQDRQLSVRTADGAEEQRVPWDQIVRIVAVKRDLFAHDLVCLLVETAPDGVVELDESMRGWQSLIEALPARLPGALPADDWLPRVQFPPFGKTLSTSIAARSP